MKISNCLYTNYRFLVTVPAIIFIVSLSASLIFEGNDKESIPVLHYSSPLTKKATPRPQDKVDAVTTSLKFSKYHVINHKDNYYINDKIQVLIEAYDSKGRPHRYGGAYFRAKLVSKDIKAASRSDGEIVDFGNGQYQAEFVLRWPGRVDVMVMLVDSNDAVYILERMRREFPNRGTYIGHFWNGSNIEHTECNIDHVAMPEKECDYTDEETNISWYCVRPTNPNLTCTNWEKHNSNNTYIFEHQTKYIRPGEEKHFITYKKYLACNNCSINVLNKGRSTGNKDKYGRLPWQKPWMTLPKCLPGSINKFENITSGYLYKDKWFSTRCRNLWFSAKSVAQCLKNKTVLILADSTGRQLYTYFLGLLKLREIKAIDCMRHARGDSINFTLYDKFHGLPSIGTGGGPSRCVRQSVANVLDHMTFVPDVFILAITPHFSLHSPDYLRQRLQIIRPAVERLHKRNPNTLFIIKSANTREFKNLSHLLSNNEWYLYTLDRLVREMFSDYPHVVLIDAWDITVSQFNPDSIHPKRSTLANIADLTLSYICPP